MRDLSGQKIDKDGYKLIKLIGEGAFGQVYQAQKSGQTDFCAVKILLPGSHTLIDFVNEIKTIFRLTHPNIVQLRDFGTTDVPDYPDPLAFFVMDYCANGTLRKRHRHGLQIPLSLIVPYVKQIAAALQHVHDQGVVHRDVKPENLLIDDRNEILLSDFGIAMRSYTRDPKRKSQPIAGTLYYMAPEQIKGQAGKASDQYALGVVIYEWLSGSLPFTGSTEHILYQHEYAEPSTLLGRTANISPEINKVVMRALKKEPKERFPHILEFAEALEEAAMVSQTEWYGPRELTYTGHGEGVKAVEWSPDGHFIASGSESGAVQIWQALTLQTHRNCDGHLSSIMDITWSADGKQLATADVDGMIFIWDVQSGKMVQQWQVYEGVRSIAWHPHKPYLISGSNDGTLRFWNTTAGTLTNTYPTHVTGIDAVVWSPDGTLFACGCEDNSVRVLEEVNYHYQSFYLSHTDRVAAIAWLPVGAAQYIASASLDCTIQVWDVIKQELYARYKDHSQAVVSLAWSPPGHYLASGSWDNSVRVWELATGACIQHYQHSDGVSGVSWSPDGHYVASSSWDGTVQIHALDARP